MRPERPTRKREERGIDGRWLPHASGNPGGRPSVPPEVKEAAKAFTIEAVDKLVALMRRAKDQRVQLAAAVAILDRGWGKPAIPITGPDGESPVVPELPELVDRLRRFADGEPS
ncbi:MAG TPA: hypothetical protein VIJ61_09875 [Thermoanaerobaculia bacterium]